MTDIIAQFLGVVGVSDVPPGTLSELIPYLLHVFVGIGVLVFILRMFRSIVMALVTHNARL